VVQFDRGQRPQVYAHGTLVSVGLSLTNSAECAGEFLPGVTPQIAIGSGGLGFANDRRPDRKKHDA